MEIIKLVLIIIVFIYGGYLLAKMPSELMKRAYDEYVKELKKRDKKYDEDQKFKEALHNYWKN